MAPTATQRRWLEALTDLPTAPGREQVVVGWVRAWARRRNLAVREDTAGNLMVSTGNRSRRRPVVAVAHMDHPALVLSRPGSTAKLRGGVHSEYVLGGAVEIVTGDRPIRARVAEYDPATKEALLAWPGKGKEVSDGAIVRWHFPPSALGISGDRLRARACDDLAGVAAALSALDRAAAGGLHHFQVLLTRAEEVGLVGAVAAAEAGTLPAGARVLSIECSRSSDEAPVGAGPIVRVGDAASVFSSGLTNQVAAIAERAGVVHQRRLMVGGVCEATAFVALGYEATGVCLALANYHNMVPDTRRGRRPRLAPEEISLRDFSGLVSLLVEVAHRIHGATDDLPRRLRAMYRSQKHLLG